jgi:O-antigen/teichoic acid export membrane protein
VSGARRLAAQVAGSAGAQVWLAFLGIFTTPFILRGLGAAAYGIFALVSVVSAHLSNLELGFGHATVRYLARARAAGDRNGEQAILDTSLAVFLAGGIVAGSVLFAAATFLATSFFHVPAGLQPAAITAFRLGAVILFASFLGSFFSASLQALGRFDWLNGSRTVFGTAAALGAVATVARGGGLSAVFAVQTAVSLASCVVLGFAVVRLRRAGLRPRFDRGALREMAGFGFVLFLAGIAYQWMVNGPPVVLAARVSTAEIPSFSIPHMILQKLAMLVASASVVFFPFASAASADSDRARLSAVFRSHLRLTFLVMAPIATYLAVFARPLLSAWVSPDFARTAAPCLQVLAFAALVLALSGPPADVARALGRPRWVLVYTTSVAVLGVGLSLLLVSSYRAFGVALAVLLSLALATVPLLVVVARRLLDLGPAALAGALARPLLAVAAAGAAWLAAARALEGVLAVLVAGVVVTAAYAAGTAVWVLESRERASLRAALPIA